MEQRACAIAGHDPKRFKFKYKEDYSLCKKIKRTIKEQIQRLYDEEGVRWFYIGGSPGVDIWAGEIVLRLKEQPGYESIELAVVLPFPEIEKNWDERSKKRLRFLIKHSVDYKIINIQNNPKNYTERDRYLVGQAEYLLAVYDNMRNEKQPITRMVMFALNRKRRIIFIHPDTARVTAVKS